jgi:hypothetical protein
MQRQKLVEPLLWARMHESGMYVFCPHCGLSFPHPPDPDILYRVGYGYCWYCFRRSPIEGGDHKGVVKVGADGEVSTQLYEQEMPLNSAPFMFILIRHRPPSQPDTLFARLSQTRLRDCDSR